jgi:hypothetical protein
VAAELGSEHPAKTVAEFRRLTAALPARFQYFATGSRITRPKIALERRWPRLTPHVGNSPRG